MTGEYRQSVEWPAYEVNEWGDVRRAKATRFHESILGTVYRPEKGQNKLTPSGGMKFDVDAMKDKSIGRLDESSGGPTPGED